MFRKLWRDLTGQALMMVTIMLPVMLGFVGLAIEGGRYMMLHSQLQDLADAAALAAAKQLTGQTGSITSARSAVNNTWAHNNYPWLSNDGTASSNAQINASDVHVCETIDTDPCVDTTDDAKARYVQVTTIARGIVPAFLTAVGAGTQTARATATAESIMVACNVQPLMLCNPFEPNGVEFADAVENGTVKKGMQFHLKILNDPGASGSNQSYAPGDFGLLDPPGMNSSGANLIRDLLSQQNPPFCYIDNVSPRTGQAVQKVNDGINVRFDIPINATNNDPNVDLSTAPVVIKGYQPKNSGYCTNGQYTDQPSWRLPRDSGTPTPYGNMTLGSGNIDSGTAATYMAAHFSAGWQAGTAVGAANRYNEYVAERNLTANSNEPKAPVCKPVSSAGADRRVISVAVIDCLANNVRGNSVTNVISNSYINLFLTEPSSAGEVWGEFMGLMTPTSSGSKIKQIVQLVRDQ
jgi:Flp pilus assembly protein TadG